MLRKRNLFNTYIQPTNKGNIMLKNTYLLQLTAIILIVTAFIGCNPEDGAEGPQGAKGEQGIQGPPGPQGEQGESGTANVMYTEWINFDNSNWNQVTEFGRVTQLYEIEEERITEEIINNGIVLMYIRLGGAPAPRLLPLTGYVTSSSLEQHIWYRLETGSITLAFHNLNNTTNPGTFGSSNSYRYIIIPGGTLITKNLSMLALKKLSYEEVSEMLGVGE